MRSFSLNVRANRKKDELSCFTEDGILISSNNKFKGDDF
jgi:hypothetical protein